jgi:hypothetical protein
MHGPLNVKFLNILCVQENLKITLNIFFKEHDRQFSLVNSVHYIG